MTAQRLLLVEDDDAVADVVALHLAQAGYGVERQADGLCAMAAIDRDGPWDLVLLDLTLPGADGLDVCRHVRQHANHLPVLILSARSAEVHRVLGLELGADDYLSKPFSMLELVARVRALLRRVDRLRQPAPAALPARFGGWELNSQRRELRRLPGAASAAGAPAALALTAREYDLLQFLLAHPHRVFSRGQLLQHVWGDAYDGFEHTVNSHINRLRSKIERDPQRPRLLATVWGAGYRFDPDPDADSDRYPR